MEREVVYQFNRNQGDAVRLTKQLYRGTLFLDLRIFIQNKQGEWQPTKKGLTILFALKAELEKALRMAAE